MARGLFVLLLVVVSAVAVSGYGRYHRRSYYRHRHSFGVRHWSSSHSWTSHRYHFGFRIHHRRFSFGSVGYKLRCGKTRFLRLWRRYYGRYGSRSRCISKLHKLHIIRQSGFVNHSSFGHRVSYSVYLSKYHGFKLHHHRFAYKGIAYKLRCGQRKFYSMWRHYYLRYHSVSRIFSRLLSKNLFVILHSGGHHINYVSYYNAHHGFTLSGKRFVYNGNSYVLKCGRTKFYRLWHRYYTQYHNVAKIFRVLYHRHVFVRHTINYVSYYNSHHGFSLTGKRFVYNGHNYILRVGRQKFYRYWYKYYTKYHNIGRIFKVFFHRHYFVRYQINYVSFYSRHQGFTLTGKHFLYHGQTYILKVQKTMFYKLWYRYYTRYHSVTKVFKVLYHRHLFTRLNYVSYYKSHHGFALTGRHFLYNGHTYVLRVTRSKFYRLWYSYYTQYHSVTKIYKALYHRHTFVRLNYSSYYTSHHGFTLTGKRFLYHGHNYVLRVRRSQFYRYWYTYYTRYHSISRTFRVLYRKHYVVRHRINYVNFYSSHHGFTLTGKKFVYHGQSYVLRVRRSQFYRYWHRYYTRYHSISRIFSALYRKHYVVRHRVNYASYYSSHHGFALTGKRFLYHGHNYVLRVRRSQFYRYWHRYYTRYHSISRTFSVLYRKHYVVRHRVNYASYYSSHHGFALTGKRFLYHGHNYVLRVRRSRFYRYWHRYYTRYHSISRTFSVLLRKHYVVRHRVNYASYYSSHHGFALTGKRFLYHGHTYILRVGRQLFYRYWHRYYTRYHSVSRTFSVLYKRQYFIRRRINYVSYYTLHHGFTLNGKRFVYNGNDYVLRVRTHKFYKLWYRYYHRYHSISKVFRVLNKRRLFVGGVNYQNYYNSHDGFELDGKRFYYNGAAYVLKVGRSRFYRYWHRYYKRYHDVDEIFNVLNRRHYIVRYGGSSKINYVNYYNTHDGFELDDNRFVYDGKTYLLKIARPMFYRLWYRYYNRYHDVDRIFKTMYGRHSFVLYNGDVTDGPGFGEFDEYLDKHNAVANHHEHHIQTITSSHVSRITHVSNAHVNRINNEANQHVGRIRGEANRHINKLRQIVNGHIRRLEQKRRKHLSDLEIQHRRHMKNREDQHRRHISTKQAVDTRHEKFISRAAAHFSDIDYLNTYHGFQIVDNKFTYDGRAYELKCSQKRWYTKWCNCYKKEHSVTSCIDSLSNGGLIAPYEAAVAATDDVGIDDDTEPAEETETVVMDKK